jgi:hypothetical protein
METASSGLLDLPPTISSILPMKHTRCWYRLRGVYVYDLGGVTQSQLPSLCFLNPQISFNATIVSYLWDPLWSFWSFLVYLRPPNTTIIPKAEPYSQMAAEWYTRGHGMILFWNSYLDQVKGPFIMFNSHTSFSALFPEFPPKTTRNGLLNSMVWPYRCPGVTFLFETSIIFQIGLY